MPEVSSSFFTFLTSYKNKPEISCRKDILSVVNWWQLTVPPIDAVFSMAWADYRGGSEKPARLDDPDLGRTHHISSPGSLLS